MAITPSTDAVRAELEEHSYFTELRPPPPESGAHRPMPAPGITDSATLLPQLPSVKDCCVIPADVLQVVYLREVPPKGTQALSAPTMGLDTPLGRVVAFVAQFASE